MLLGLLVTVPLIGAAINAAIAVYAARDRVLPGARSFAVALGVVALWGVAYSCEIATSDLAMKLVWMKLRFPFFFIGVIWLVMALQLTGRDAGLRRWHMALMCVVPALTALLLFTTEQTGLVRHGLHIATDGPVPMLVWHSGPVWHVFLAQTYILTALTVYVLVASLRGASFVLRRQVYLLLAATFVVVGLDGISSSGLGPIRNFDLTWLAFIISGVLVGLALFRYGMFGVLPIATRLIVATMPSAVFVLDSEHRVVYANQAALRLAGKTEAEAVGRPTTDVLALWTETVQQYYDVECGGGEVTVAVDGEPRSFNLTITPLQDRRGHALGRLGVAHDVTELKRAKEAAEAALASVHVLTGLLPICASCKSIRDDQGYWQAVDQYMAEHTEIEFTHGFCPDCARRLLEESRARIKASKTAASGAPTAELDVST